MPDLSDAQAGTLQIVFKLADERDRMAMRALARAGPHPLALSKK